MLRRKGSLKPKITDDLVRIHSLLIYTVQIEYKIVGNRKAPLLSCFCFVSKLKTGDIVTTGQYKNYQTLSNLEFRPLLKNLFHSLHIDLRETSGEKTPFVSVKTSCLVLMFIKASSIYFYLKDVTRWLLQDNKRFHSREVLVDNVDEDSVNLHKLLGELQFHSCTNISSQLQIA